MFRERGYSIIVSFFIPRDCLSFIPQFVFLLFHTIAVPRYPFTETYSRQGFPISDFPIVDVLPVFTCEVIT